MSEIIEQGGGEVVDTGPAAPALSPAPDLDFAPPGPALVGLSDGGNVLEFGSDGFLHLGLSATDNSSGAAVPLAGLAVQMTVVDASRGLPVQPVLLWLPATWLNAPGTGLCYATLGAGPDHTLLLPAGPYWLYARVAAGSQIYILRSAAPFLVRL